MKAASLPPTEPVQHIPASSVWSLLMLAESSPLSIYIYIYCQDEAAVKLREFFHHAHHYRSSREN